MSCSKKKNVVTKKNSKHEFVNVVSEFVIRLESLSRFMNDAMSALVSNIQSSSGNVEVVSNTPKKICAVSANNRRRTFNTVMECSKSLSIDHGNISKVLHGKRKTAGGYRFEYAK